MDRIRAFFTALILAASSLPAYAIEMELKPDDLPKLLKGQNQSVLAASRFSEAAELRTGHLMRSYLPSLELTGGAEKFQTGIYNSVTQPYGSAEARINLFRGGKDLLEEQAREAQSNATRAESQQTYLVSLSEVRKLYWELVYHRESIGILKEALAQTEKILVAANRRIQRGVTTDTDRLDFEISRDMLKEEIASLEHETLIDQIKLRGPLSVSDDTTFKTLEMIPHAHDESLVRLDPESKAYPQVVSLAATGESYIRQGSKSARWWTPSLDLYGGYYLFTLREREYLSQNLRSDTAVGVRITLQLFDGLQSSREASSLSAQGEAYSSRAAQEARIARSRLRAAQEALKHEHELIHLAEERIKQGALYYKKTVSEYDRGVKNSPDVLGALQRQISFKRRYAELRRDYQDSKSELLGMIGDL
jgi:outer membrane protein